MPSNSRLQLEEWLSLIEVPKYTKVLDVGGSQKPVKGRTKTWEADLVNILDLEFPHEGGQREIIGDIQGPMSELGNATFIEEFDIAFCLEVSEYWTKPFDALRNIWLMLKSGGILYASFHFVYPHHNPTDQDCLRYTKTGVTKLLTQAGFGDIEITERTTEQSSFRAFFRGEGMRPAVQGDINHEAVGWLIRCKKI